MFETDNPDGLYFFVAFFVIASAIVVIGVWLFGKFFRSKYSPFKFVKRLLSVEMPINVTTSLSPAATESRLRERVTRIGVPLLMSQRLVGRISGREIKIRLHRQFMSNSFAPVFAGSVGTEDGRTVVRGVCRLHKYVRAFMTFWFGFIIIWSTVGIPSGIAMLIGGQPDGVMFVLIPFVMFGAGVGFVKFGEYIAVKDHKLIAQKIAEAIGGTVSSS